MVGLWRKLPVVARAVVLGSFVFAVAGAVAWPLVLTVVPPPWSLFVMILFLWFYWRYFSGDGPPEGTSTFRKESSRRGSLAGRVWGWSLFSGLWVVVFLHSTLNVTFRVLEYSPDQWTLPYDLSGLSTITIWGLLILAALVAGLTEELGFRGYMQTPLERRYGPGPAVFIVSAVFVVFHLNQAWAPPVLVPIFLVSVLWGVLAVSSGSLIPGVLSHTAADVINFSYWWTDVAGRFDRRPISETGIDLHFLGWSCILLVSLAGFWVGVKKTATARKSGEVREGATNG